MGDHEIKKINFADNTTMFLRDITYLDRIQVLAKLWEHASSAKINFSKGQGIKILKVNSGNSTLDNCKWDITSECIAKIYIWNWEKRNLKSNPLIHTHTHTHTHKKNHQKWIYNFFRNKKNKTSKTLSSTPHLDEWTRYFGHRDTINLSKNKMGPKLINFHQCTWKSLMLYQMNFILNYNQRMAFFRYKQIFRSTSNKHSTKTEQPRFLYSINPCLATFYQ